MAKSSQVGVTNSATIVATASGGAQTVLVQNLDATNDVFLGDSNVTTGTGMKLPKSTANPFQIFLSPGEVLYAIASVAGPTTVHVLRTGPGA